MVWYDVHTPPKVIIHSTQLNPTLWSRELPRSTWKDFQRSHVTLKPVTPKHESRGDWLTLPEQSSSQSNHGGQTGNCTTILGCFKEIITSSYFRTITCKYLVEYAWDGELFLLWFEHLICESVFLIKTEWPTDSFDNRGALPLLSEESYRSFRRQVWQHTRCPCGSIGSDLAFSISVLRSWTMINVVDIQVRLLIPHVIPHKLNPGKIRVVWIVATFVMDDEQLLHSWRVVL